MREVYRNRSLRRLQLAWGGSIIGTWAYSVALVVYAYQQGGTSAVGSFGGYRSRPSKAQCERCEPSRCLPRPHMSGAAATA